MVDKWTNRLNEFDEENIEADLIVVSEKTRKEKLSLGVQNGTVQLSAENVADSATTCTVTLPRMTSNDTSVMSDNAATVLIKFYLSINGGASNFCGQCDFFGGIQQQKGSTGAKNGGEMPEAKYTLSLQPGINRVLTGEAILSASQKIKVDVEFD